MGSPATRAVPSDADGWYELTQELIGRGVSFEEIPRAELRREIVDVVEEGAVRGIAWAVRMRSHWTTRKGGIHRSRVDAAVRKVLTFAAPERTERIGSPRAAATFFAFWLMASVRRLIREGRPLSDLDLLLSDESFRGVLDLCDGGGSFFDRHRQRTAPDERWSIDGVNLSGSKLRGDVRRRCEEIISAPWRTEVLDRTLGHAAIIDVIGGRVARPSVTLCQTLLVDAPGEVYAELNAALFAQLDPRSRAAVTEMFADSPHRASALWWPATTKEVHAAAVWWLEQNPPQPALFAGAETDPVRGWFEALVELTGHRYYYRRRNRAHGDRLPGQLNADLVAATFAEIARRANLVCRSGGRFVRRRTFGAAPVFELDARPVAELLERRLGRDLRHSDLEALPTWLSKVVASEVAPPDEEPIVVGDGQLFSRGEVFRFAMEYAATHDRYLPGKSQIRNLSEVEELLGCTWWDFCEELIEQFPGLRRTLSSYARDGIALISECFGAPVEVEAPVSVFAPNAEDASRCKVDATLWLDDNTVLWFEFDGEGHFVRVINWDLERARAGDRRRHRQLRAARTAGTDVTLVAFHHSVLPVSGGPLTPEGLAEIVEWAELEGYKWLFLRPVGCEQLRDSEADAGDLLVTRFGDVEVVATELVRPVRD